MKTKLSKDEARCLQVEMGFLRSSQNSLGRKREEGGPWKKTKGKEERCRSIEIKGKGVEGKPDTQPPHVGTRQRGNSCMDGPGNQVEEERYQMETTGSWKGKDTGRVTLRSLKEKFEKV